jgi:excisionase family DNA binding protein
LETEQPVGDIPASGAAPKSSFIILREGTRETMLDHELSIQRPGPEPMLLTFKETMDFLRVSRSTLYRLMWAGQLRGHKVGSTWRFHRQDLLSLVADSAQAVARPIRSYEGQ